MSAKVTVTGLADLERSLSQFEKTATKRTIARRAIKQALTPIMERARQLAPDDPATGPPDLKTSFHIGAVMSNNLKESIPRGKTIVTQVTGPTTNAYPQAWMQEYGTVHHAPQPYMRPAYDSLAQGALDELAAQIGKEIERAKMLAARRAAKAGK